MDTLTGYFFKMVGFEPTQYPILWTFIGIALLAFLAYVLGVFIETGLMNFVHKIYSKIPGYNTINELINIFNTSKSGEKKVLVVLVKGFSKQEYNIGLMYSTKESIVKDHYTVVLSMTPIPNGGFMFETHKDNIWVIEEATFDANLQYLLSMGVKSMRDILNCEARDINEFKTIASYLKEKENKEIIEE